MRDSISRKFTLSTSASVLALMMAAPAWANHVALNDVQSNYNDPGSSNSAYRAKAPMGVSGSSQAYLTIHNVPYCYTGTLGSEVLDPKNSGNRWVLSNNHVLAKENENLDYPGEGNRTIIQAGLMDGSNCSSQPAAASVAYLSRFVEVVFSKGKTQNTNYVDAAIATADTNVKSEILGLGDVAGFQDHQDIAFGEKVQKVGRTTAHTMGEVTTIKNSLKVSYESGTAYFDDQIGIQEVCGGSFSDAGDSGSLVSLIPDYNDPKLNSNEAVGLLFAGDSTYTWANEIDEVLNELNGGGKLTDSTLLHQVSGSSAAVDIVKDSDPGGVSYYGPSASDYDTYAANNCQTSGSSGPPSGKGKKKFVKSPAGLDRAIRVKENHSQEIFAMPNVVGHGIGEDDDGNAVINIYISQNRGGRYYPPRIEGVNVRVIKTGPIKAY